jgi:hypothetical protein
MILIAASPARRGRDPRSRRDGAAAKNPTREIAGFGVASRVLYDLRMKWIVLVALLAPISNSAADPAEVPVRRVALSFVEDGTVISSPTSLVGGGQCQTFRHGIVGHAPTVAIEYCASADDRVRIRWIVRRDGRVLARDVTGSFAEGATFEAGIPDVIDVPVTVSAP